tara:strand:- start:548 stop:1036 length:489 start_codon:yes stop_codon:yes gene_type:complete
MTQNLSPTARRMKAIRDKRMAMTTDRKAKKAENQRKRRANPAAAKDKDYDHKTSTFKSVKANRGNDGKGTKIESGKKYRVGSPIKKANKKLVEQAGNIRKKAKEIEDEFINNFTITTNSRGLTDTEKQEIKELKKNKAKIRAANKKRRLDASLKNLNKKQNN